MFSVVATGCVCGGGGGRVTPKNWDQNNIFQANAKQVWLKIQVAIVSEIGEVLAFNIKFRLIVKV